MELGAVQDHYPDEHAQCYGCGRLNAHGLHVRSVREGDHVSARYRPEPDQIAMPGFVYGGLIASIVDCHAIAAAAGHALAAEGRAIGDGPSPRFVTAALRLDYLKPTPMGVELVLRAWVEEASSRKTRIRVSVAAGSAETARAEVIAVPLPRTMAAPGAGSTGGTDR